MEQDEMMINQIDGNLFEVFWNIYGDRISLNKDFIKKVFLAVDLRYKHFISDSSVSDALLKNIGVYDMINYICYEHRFHLALVHPEKIIQIEQDETYFKQLVNICYDKLLFNEYSDVNSSSVISKFNVEITMLNMFTNRLFALLSQTKIATVKDKLMGDIFGKCFMLMKSTLRQLCDGLETEAMSSWRTLHELFCVLCVINKGEEKVAKAYYRHLEYGAYNRGEITEPEKVSKILENMEKDMLYLEVKKSNREKFINYGWIHWAYKRYNDEEVKLNFLGGLQKVADMTQYKKYYEIASDVTHSTPLLVYANKAYLTNTTLKVTYETFFILEPMFVKWCLESLQMNPTEKPFADYQKFKLIYKQKLEIIYQIINKRNIRK